MKKLELLKEKWHQKVNSSNAKTVTIISLVFFMIAGYLFFFISPIIFGTQYEFTVTLPGEEQQLESGHNVKLVRSDIDYSNNKLEYELYFINSNYDNKSDYKIDIRSTNKNGKITPLKTEVVCSDTDLFVIRADFTKKFEAISLTVSIQNEDGNNENCKFYSDKESLHSVNCSSDTSREYFLKLDTQRNIENLNNEIDRLTEENAALDEKINKIDENIKSLQERMSYMTSAELENANSDITTMTNEKNSSMSQIDNNNKQISEYRDNIQSLQANL